MDGGSADTRFLTPSQSSEGKNNKNHWKHLYMIFMNTSACVHKHLHMIFTNMYLHDSQKK